MFMLALQREDWLLEQLKLMQMKVFFLVMFCGFILLFIFHYVLCFTVRSFVFWLFQQLNLRHRIRRRRKMDQASISFLVLKELPKNQWVNFSFIAFCFGSLIWIWKFHFNFRYGWMFEMITIRLWPCLGKQLN